MQRTHSYDVESIVTNSCGTDDPLNLIVEIKGQKDTPSKMKAEAARTLWVPGVNNLKSYGRWGFVEFSDVFAIEDEFGKLVETFRNEASELEVA